MPRSGNSLLSASLRLRANEKKIARGDAEAAEKRGWKDEEIA
jgi:hypothetical protein